MKKLFLLFAGLLLALSVQAQGIEFGPKAGLSMNFNNFKDQIKNDNFSLKDEKNRLGYQVGAWARVGLLGLYIQPEVLFSRSSSEVTLADPQAALETVIKTKYNRLDIPVLVGMRFLKLVRINAGPLFTTQLSNDVKFTDPKGTFADIKADVKKDLTVGLQAGAGLDISRLSLDVRYQTYFNKNLQDVLLNGQSVVDTNQAQILFSVGYKLF